MCMPRIWGTVTRKSYSLLTCKLFWISRSAAAVVATGTFSGVGNKDVSLVWWVAVTSAWT